jgi:hypothetical protein
MISHALPPSVKGKSVQAQQRHSTENPHPFLWEPDATFVTETTHYPTEQQVVATINGPIGQRRTASFAIGTESGEQLGDVVGVRSASLEADLRVRFSPRPTGAGAVATVPNSDDLILHHKCLAGPPAQ